MIELLKDYIGEIAVSVVATLIGYITNRTSKRTAVKQSLAALAQKDAEIDSLKLNNSSQLLDEYRKSLDDLDKRYESKHAYLEKDYDRRIKDMKEDYERRIQFINQTNDQRYNSLSRKYDKLKSDFNTYKEKHP